MLAYATIVTDRIAVRGNRNPSRLMTLALCWSSGKSAALSVLRGRSPNQFDRRPRKYKRR